jgi:hypothetical protein
VYVLFFTVQGRLKRCAEKLFNCSTLYTAGAVKESVLVLAVGKGLVRLRMCLCGGEVVGASTGFGACRECSGRSDEALVIRKTTGAGDCACADGAGVGEE